MIAAVSGCHPAIRETRALDDRLLVADLLECEGWSCVGDTPADALVIDGDIAVVLALHVDVCAVRLALGRYCVDCLPMAAGWWSRSRPMVSVLWPVDSTIYPADLGVAS